MKKKKKRKIKIHVKVVPYIQIQIASNKNCTNVAMLHAKVCINLKQVSPNKYHTFKMSVA